MPQRNSTRSFDAGFTLIELLVVIGIIAILAAIVIIAINPAKRFQDARNSQRHANVESILSAIQQNMVDSKGITTCTITSTATDIKNGGADLAVCLKSYLAVLPMDPQTGTGDSTTATYDTRYSVMMDATTKQVTVASLDSAADGGGTISMTR